MLLPLSSPLNSAKLPPLQAHDHRTYKPIPKVSSRRSDKPPSKVHACTAPATIRKTGPTLGQPSHRLTYAGADKPSQHQRAPMQQAIPNVYVRSCDQHPRLRPGVSVPSHLSTWTCVLVTRHPTTHRGFMSFISAAGLLPVTSLPRSELVGTPLARRRAARPSIPATGPGTL